MGAQMATVFVGNKSAPARKLIRCGQNQPELPYLVTTRLGRETGIMSGEQNHLSKTESLEEQTIPGQKENPRDQPFRIYPHRKRTPKT